MQRPKARRSILTLAACAAGAAVGIAIGLALCRFVVLLDAHATLVDRTRLLLDVSEEAGRETMQVLQAANASPHGFCSDAEIVLLRELAFRARQVKDVGRLRDGRLVCSGTLGLLPAPLPMPRPSAVTHDGLQVYADIPLAVSSQVRATVVQSGASSAVMSPDIYRGLVPAPFGYTVAIVDAQTGQVSRSWGLPLRLPPASVLRTGALRVDGTMYQSACSAGLPFCAVTQVAVADVLASRGRSFWLAGLLGGLLGAGLVFLLIRRWLSEPPLERRLRQAIRRGSLSVAYQPIVDLADGRPVGAEALVRWRNETGIPIAAEVFIKIAEDKGFIGEITRFVLRDVLDQLGPTLRSRPEFRVNVNVAPTDIGDSWLLYEMHRRLSQAHVPARQIGLELTERSMADRSVAIDAIRRLREQGHVVYIDDFGTGYSSLSYLNELNVDVLKIDRSFTRTVRTEAVTASIVPQIVGMARTLNLGIVVEGIERPEQVDYFRLLGGQIHGQGHHFAPPMSARDFIAWLDRHAGPPAPQ